MSDKPTFDVKPRKGVVKPGTHTNIQVVYTPSEEAWKKDEELITCQVEDGQDIQFRCFGMVPQSKIVPNHKEINFGIISIGSDPHQTLIFRNMSKNGALFNIKSKIEGLTIVPT